MYRYTALHPDSELNEHFRQGGNRAARDVNPFTISTNIIEELTSETEYERVTFWNMPSSTIDVGGVQRVIFGNELLQIAGGYMAGNYLGALEFLDWQAEWLLASPEFQIFMGDDLEAKAALMAALTGA